MKKFKDYFDNPALKSSIRLSKEAIAVAGLWHENNSQRCSLYLADMPMSLHKNNMINSTHLVELEELFQEIAFKAHQPDFETMYDAALDVCPDLLLHHSDEYLAGLINKLSIDRKHKNIFVICGYGQSRTVPYHLYYNPRVFNTDTGFDTIVKHLPPFETLIRKDNPQIQIDKLAIIDQIISDGCAFHPDEHSSRLIWEQIAPRLINEDGIPRRHFEKEVDKLT